MVQSCAKSALRHLTIRKTTKKSNAEKRVATKNPFSGPFVVKREKDSRNGFRGISIYAEGWKVAIANMVMDPHYDNELATANLIAELLNWNEQRE